MSASKNGVIWKDNKIPWRVRGDLIHLKSLTQDQMVVLGRKTYDSMALYYDASGREMPAKQYIVVTRDESYQPARKNASVAHSLKEAFRFVENLNAQVYVIGGVQIYEQALPYAHKLHITEIDADIKGDAFSPVIDKSKFKEVSRELHKKDAVNEYDYSFVVYERIK